LLTMQMGYLSIRWPPRSRWAGNTGTGTRHWNCTPTP
jgi:hypothetical protein